MPRFLVFLSLIGLLSCKTSGNRSKLDSAWWLQDDKVNIVHFANNTFAANYCQKTPALMEALKTAKNADAIVKICNDSVVPILPGALRDALIEEILRPATDSLRRVKSDRMEYVRLQITSVERIIADLDATLENLDDETRETIGSGIRAEQAIHKKNIADYKHEFEKLNLAKNDPARLKAVDIEVTLRLESKIASTATEQATLLTEILASAKLYALDTNRDYTLIAALSRFEPACSFGMKSGDRVKTMIGIEEVEFTCENFGKTKVSSRKCSLPGYEMLGGNEGNMSCIFTGQNLKLDRIVATGEGICGLTASGNEITCWGKAGRFPLNENGPSLGGSDSNKPRIQTTSLGSSREQVCAFQADGSLQSCWPAFTSVPIAAIKYQSVQGGESHLCGIGADQSVLCWGSNSFGQSALPPGFQRSKLISSHVNANCAVTQNDNVTCWGRNSGTFSLDPKFSLAPNTIASVNVGYDQVCALSKDKKVSCWAEGRGTLKVPTDLPAARQVFVSRYENCAISTSDDLICWGDTPDAGQYKKAPRLKEVRSLFADHWKKQMCATYGPLEKVECWGSDLENKASTMIPPSDLINVKTIAVTTDGYACAINGSGEVKCWGNKTDIALPPPGTLKM